MVELGVEEADACCSSVSSDPGVLGVPALLGDARRPSSRNSSSPPATRWNSETEALVQRRQRYVQCDRHTWLAPPHVSQHLDVAGDLLLAAYYAMLLEVVDQKLVAPAAAATRVGGPGGLPVLSQAWGGRLSTGNGTAGGQTYLVQRPFRRPPTRLPFHP